MSYRLDAYDCEMISLIKRGCVHQPGQPIVTLDDFFHVYAKRTALSMYQVKVEYIVNHLATIAHELNLTNTPTFIALLAKAQDDTWWNFGFGHWSNCLVVLCNIFSMTKVVDLPGYNP